MEKKLDKSNGFCSHLAKPFGEVMEGNILWAKSAMGLADAGFGIVNLNKLLT